VSHRNGGLTPAQHAVIEHVTSFFSARSVEVAPFDDSPIGLEFCLIATGHWDARRSAVV
jgi:hypothetical protein